MRKIYPKLWKVYFFSETTWDLHWRSSYYGHLGNKCRFSHNYLLAAKPKWMALCCNAPWWTHVPTSASGVSAYTPHCLCTAVFVSGSSRLSPKSHGLLLLLLVDLLPTKTGIKPQTHTHSLANCQHCACKLEGLEDSNWWSQCGLEKRVLLNFYLGLTFF